MQILAGDTYIHSSLRVTKLAWAQESSFGKHSSPLAYVLSVAAMAGLTRCPETIHMQSLKYLLSSPLQECLLTPELAQVTSVVPSSSYLLWLKVYK